MPFTQAMTANNLLLAALPRKDREELLAHCEQVELLFAEELYHAGETHSERLFPDRKYYYPDDAYRWRRTFGSGT